MPHHPSPSRKASPGLSPISEASAEDAVIPPLALAMGPSRQYESLTNLGLSRASKTSQSSSHRPKQSLDSVVRTSVNDLLNTISINSSTGGNEHYLDSVRAAHSIDKLVPSSGYNPFDGKDVLDLLEYDERPIFVIDLRNARDTSGSLNIVYANKSLRKHTESFKRLQGHVEPGESPGAHWRFNQWVTRIPSHTDASDTPRGAILFANFKWTSSVLQRTLKVCRGYSETQRPFTPRSQPVSPSLGHSQSSPNKENERTPTRERGDYFGSSDLKDGRHARTRSLDYKTKDRNGQNYRDSRTPPQREELSSASKKSSDLFNGNEIDLPASENPESPSLHATIREAFKDIDRDEDTTDDDEEHHCLDFIRMSNVSHLSKHIQYIKNSPWDFTILGPMEGWSPELRQAVNMIVASPHPAALYWSQSFIIIYNEAYVNVAGPKHPFLMGKSYPDAWKEIWHLLEETFLRAFKQGETASQQCDLLCITRYGNRLEECYFDWAIIPILGENGSVVGLYNPCFEQTRQVISERQTATLRSIGEHTARAQTMRTFWLGVVEGLKTNKRDIPFAMVYSTSQEVDSDSPKSSIKSGSQASITCTLEAHIGISDTHSILQGSYMDLFASQFPTASLMREAIKNKGPLYRSIDDETLHHALLSGITSDIWDHDDCRAIVICPIFVAQREHPQGFLITGVNTRRPYDQEYYLHMNQLSRQVETSMASVILVEDEITKGQKAARVHAIQQSALTEKLKMTAEEAAANEERFTILTQLNPTGLFIASPSGEMIYCNKSFYDTMGVTEEDFKKGTWMRKVATNDVDGFSRCWDELINDQKPLDAEIRLEIPWTTPSGAIGQTWAVVKAKPDVTNPDGFVRSILGCILHISQQKWAELSEVERKREAVVRKQEQEQFIDMTSHEMRNPLSSILQCADEVARRAAELAAAPNLTDAQRRMIGELLLVSNTLSLCGQHEKRIVDDILTLSKMEAGKLQVSPESVDPKEMIEVARTMFKYDIKYFDIELVVRVDKSYDDLGVKWVNVDPSRVLAVLVNLTTNSIKFTAKEKKRRITITLGASLEPAKGFGSVTFVPKQNNHKDPTAEPDWGTGDAVYLHYSVSDTGRGLNETELSNLFKRFSQASDKTHVSYGGSGLGLFIARLLSEVHGGQIGVASTTGKGSTFSFYVKSKRTTTEPASRLKQELVKPKGELHILLVEDNTIVAATAARNLKSNGCVVHLAEDGIACLEQLKRSQYYAKRDHKNSSNIRVDVVLMDQQMPRMDGLECAKEIRKLTEEGFFHGHIPVIGTTANARAEQLELVVDAGMVNLPPRLIFRILLWLTRYRTPSSPSPSQWPTYSLR